MTFPDGEPLDILVFGAHPDDAEIGMGGTIAKHTAAGRRVGVCDLTYAEMSSNGTVESRQEEAAAASEILGLAGREVLGLPDRGLHGTAEQIAAVTLAIRRFRPRLVFAPFLRDRHPDHVACGRLVKEAVFNAKLRKYMAEHPPVNVAGLFYYFINDVQEPDLAVDVSASYSSKEAALRAYASQFTPPAGGSGFVSTPLNQGYLERVAARDSLLGQKLGTAYAEGFMTVQPFPVDFF